MEILRIWFCCCLLFCIYCLSILIDASYQVTYIADDEGAEKEEKFKFLACVDLESFFSNRTEIDLQEVRGIFIDYIQEQFPRRFFDEKASQAILNRTRSNDSALVVMRDNACILLDGEQEFKLWRSLEVLSFFAFKEESFRWIRFNRHDDGHDDQHEPLLTLIVLNEGPPFSNCSKSNDRPRCLNECFKRGFRLSRYFYYFANETDPIYRLKSNRTVEEHEKRCFLECSRPSCKMLYLKTNSFFDKFENVIAFRAQPVVSNFEFSVQLAGLVCLILSVSFGRLLSAAIWFVSSKFRNRRLRICLFYLRHFLLFVGLMSCVYLFAHLIDVYKEKITNPARKETTKNLEKPETIHLVVCVAVEHSLSNYTWVFGARKKRTLPAITMLELEKATDGALNYSIDQIVLSYQEKEIKIEWKNTPKVLFQTTDRESRFLSLDRCFQLTIWPRESYYQMKLAISKLKIKFKNQVVRPELWKKSKVYLFLLENERDFNTKSFQYVSNAVLKRIDKRSRLNGKCVDYEASYSHLGCMSRQSCIERCIARSYFEAHRNITAGVDGPDGFRQTIDKDLYTPTEWATAYPVNSRDALLSRQSCLDRIPDDKPCVGTRFRNSVRIIQPDANATEINLYHVVLQSTEEQPSAYKLTLDIVNVESIFFGLAVLELLSMINKLVQTKLRIRRNTKAIPLIYLACLVGFGCHIYHILDEIVNGELVPSQFYQLANEVQMPEIVFCFSIDERLIDKNQKLTGNYLEELTAKMTAESVFETIAYLNDQNDWEQLKSNFSTEIFKIETFFFLFKKCFSLKLDTTYTIRQFSFQSTGGEVLRLKFNRTLLTSEEKTIHFMTKKADTMQFSKILKLIAYRVMQNYFTTIYSHYSILQERFLLRFEDKFKLIKSFFRRPLSLFSGQEDINDLNGYLNRLLRGFKEKYNKVTLNLPIRANLFHLQIDDCLFQRHFSAVYEEDLKAPVSLNYEREYAINFLRNFQIDDYTTNEEYYESPHPDFTFSLTHFKKIVLATNEENYAVLILSLLNALSIWFGLKLLDVPGYVFAFKRFLRLLRRAALQVKDLLRGNHQTAN